MSSFLCRLEPFETNSSKIVINGLQERYYPSGKLYGKINIINNKVEGTETTYYENGKTISELNYNQGKLISGKV